MREGKWHNLSSIGGLMETQQIEYFAITNTSKKKNFYMV